MFDKKIRSLGQIIEIPMLVARGCDSNPRSLMLYHTIWKAQVSDSRAIMAHLFSLWIICFQMNLSGIVIGLALLSTTSFINFNILYL